MRRGRISRASARGLPPIAIATDGRYSVEIERAGSVDRCRPAGSGAGAGSDCREVDGVIPDDADLLRGSPTWSSIAGHTRAFGTVFLRLPDMVLWR